MGGKDLTQWELFCDEQRCDACHPNDSGYSYMAAKIYHALFPKPLPGKGDTQYQSEELFYGARHDLVWDFVEAVPESEQPNFVY
jgi:hypothetical protein